MRNFISLPALIFLSCAGSTCFAQKSALSFNRIDPPEGSYFGTLGGITQDPKGYMWFGSAGSTGFFRYDGYQMINYKNDPANPNSLSNNWVECIYADAAGIIWLGTFGNGLDRFDPATGVFTHYPPDPKNPSATGRGIVTVIYEDREGELWIGTHGGLDLLDRKTGRFTHYRHDPSDPSSLSNDQVRVIYEDKQGTLWIGTGSPWVTTSTGRAGEPGVEGDGGLNRLDRKTGKFTRYMHDSNNPYSLAENKVRAIFEDSRGTFWIGSTGADGLQIMDRAKGTFRHFTYDPLHPENLSRPPVNKNISYDHISFITEDAVGKIWIGTVGAGINRYDPVTQKIKHYDYRDSATGFTSNSAWSHYTSRDGVFWISSFDDGKLYNIDLFRTNIPHINTTENFYFPFETPPGIQWQLTNDGLIQKNKITGKIRKFVNEPGNPGSLSNNLISSVAKDSFGNLWVSTRGGGLNRYNYETETFTHYRHDEKNINTPANDTIYFLYADKTQNLWIGAVNGVDVMDLATGKFTHYKDDPREYVHEMFYIIYKDRQGRVWVTTNNGISRLDTKTGRFKRFKSGESINKVFQDSSGIIWGAGNSLYRFDEQADQFVPVTNPSSGKDFGQMGFIIEDDQKNLWFTSYAGIIKFNPEQNKAVTYGKNAGVVGSQLDGFANKDTDGMLYFHDYNGGYYALYPKDISSKAKAPEIILTDFRISNKAVLTGRSGPLADPLWKTKNIKLRYDQNVFSLGYIVVDYADPGSNQSMYMLENYDDDWRPWDINTKAYYFNLPPGDYTFKIKAVNGGGTSVEKDISIIITPPWWRTWWAYCVYGVLLIAFAYALHRTQKQRVIKAERERTRERELAQAKEIEKAYHALKTTQAQLIQSEKMASLGELTAGIAHEIQNPLNFVNNFSEVNKEMVDEATEEIDKGNYDEVKIILNDIKDNSEKINHHGKRADAIVKGMLQHSKASTGKKEPTDLNALCDEYLRLAYHGLRAKDKSFNADFKTDFDESIGKINVVPQDIGRVLLNLYNNAFYSVNEKMKHAEKDLTGSSNLSGQHYVPTVTVVTKKLNDKVEIIVSDNGVGIPQKVLDKIFQPFFTTKPTGQGTGLGLSLAYDIIKAHGGEIKVETKVDEGNPGKSGKGEGSEFIILLPA